MPWKHHPADEEQLCRRFAYYIHWRCTEHGKKATSKATGVSVDLLTSYAQYAFTGNNPPALKMSVVYRLASHWGDDFSVLVFAIQRSPDYHVFKHLLTTQVMAARDVDAAARTEQAIMLANMGVGSVSPIREQAQAVA